MTCRDLLNVIRKKKTGAEIENLLFHQDNALVHLAQETLQKFFGFGADKPGSLDCDSSILYFFHSSSRTCEETVSLMIFWGFTWQLEQLFLVMIRHGTGASTINDLTGLRKWIIHKREYFEKEWNTCLGAPWQGTLCRNFGYVLRSVYEI